MPETKGTYFILSKLVEEHFKILKNALLWLATLF